MRKRALDVDTKSPIYSHTGTGRWADCVKVQNASDFECVKRDDISTKELYISAKQPYISAEEPWISR